MSTLTAPAAPLRQDASTVGLISVAHGMSHFGQLIVPPLFPWIGADFGLSNTQLGFLLTVFFVVSFAGQAAAGFVVDRFGAQKVLFGGLGLLTTGALGLALAPSYAVMLVFIGLAGLGNCVFHPVDFSILNARISTPRLGHAYAAHGISGNVGWALAPVFVVGITHATGSWRMALGASSALIALVLLLVVIFRQTLTVPPSQARTGDTASVSRGSLGFLKLSSVWSCFGFFLIYALALGGVQSFAPAAAGALHEVPAAQIAICLSIYMVTAGAGMVLGGHLLRDPARSVRIVALGFGTSVMVALAIGLGQWPPAAVPVLFALLGIGAGIAGPSRDLLVKQATPEGATGRVYGVVYSGLDVGMALAPLIFGALMDRGHHRAVWVGIAFAMLLLIANAFNVKRLRRRPIAPAAA